MDNTHQQLILRDELQQLWQNNDVFAEVQQLRGEVVRDVPGRQTLRFALGGRNYYRKLHTGVGWGEIFKNLVRGRLPIISAQNEWTALNRLAALGVPSLTPVAFGKKNKNPARQLSFIVTRELAGAVELDKFLRNAPQVTFTQKRALISEIARITRIIHIHGINHRDLYLCHFLLELSFAQSSQLTPTLYLVDLHRAQIRAQVPRRWRVKDLASLYFSAMDLGITRGDILRFLTVYFAQPLKSVVQENARLLQDVHRRALKLYHREQRLKARGLR